MQDGPIQAPETREISPFDPARDHSAHLSRRTYNLLMGALIAFGFVVMGACAALATTPGFLLAIYEHWLPVTIGSFAASIAGIFVISAGMKREGYGMALAGYGLVVLSMGFATGLILPAYDIPSIANAFVGTAIIAALFMLLGVTYPQVFVSLYGVAAVGLGAVLLISVIGIFVGAPMAWLDYVVILLFCGFIGFDTYRAQQCEPTVKMAIFNAVEIWLDLLNVFIRILSIVGRRN